MFEAEMISGTIESNNGTEALVSFADGAEKLFERTAESETEFLANFPIGGTVEAKRVGGDISRQGLFDPIKNLFGDRRIAYSVVAILKRGKTVLVGIALNISGLAVFCGPDCESPNGDDGRYFALGCGEQWEWLAVSQENLEYVCGEIGKAAAKRATVP